MENEVIILNVRNHSFALTNFLDRVSLGSPGLPETYYADQTGFELTDICLSLPPEC